MHKLLNKTAITFDHLISYLIIINFTFVSVLNFTGISNTEFSDSKFRLLKVSFFTIFNFEIHVCQAIKPKQTNLKIICWNHMPHTKQLMKCTALANTSNLRCIYTW